jgi:hypothetical protein
VATRRHGDGIEQQDEAADEISVTFDARPAPPTAPVATLPGPSFRPSNAFSILTPKLNARTGAATLRFRLAGPGLLRGLVTSKVHSGRKASTLTVARFTRTATESGRHHGQADAKPPRHAPSVRATPTRRLAESHLHAERRHRAHRHARLHPPASATPARRQRLPLRDGRQPEAAGAHLRVAMNGAVCDPSATAASRPGWTSCPRVLRCQGRLKSAPPAPVEKWTTLGG